MKQLRLESNHEFIELIDFLALPKLIERGEKYDLIFISGWHNFEYILLCVLFASMLVKVDGYIVINNKYNNRVNKCINYIDSNYNNLTKVNGDSSLVIYKKNNEEKKDYNEFNNF